MEKEVKTTWAFDPIHTKIGFKVKHLMITNVLGGFREFDGQVVTDGNDFTSASVTVSLNTASIDTEMPDRDKHLKSQDFFDIEKYPKITFISTNVKDLGDEMYELSGNLTIKDITRPVILSVEYGGLITDPWGNIKAGFSLSAKISRKDWGLTWNAALESGGVLVGDEVKILSDIELVRKA